MVTAMSTNMDHPKRAKEVLTVSRLTEQIQFMLEAGFDVVWVEGEVSNLRKPASGHLYFTLKDEESQIRAVLFRPYSRMTGFELADGMHVVCRARLNVYKPRGEYQLILDALEPRGVGALQIAFEQLKAKLHAEGLFEPALKKPIPYLPARIGIVTSPSGAVIQDILKIIGRRYPSADILIVPVRVQGAEAPPEIVEALSVLNEMPDIDVIILARGGGSLEDLAPFNDERVARAIHASRVPVISAVGHEIDYTISDFAADLRAPTPSAAAELVVPVKGELIQTTALLHGRLRRSLLRLLSLKQERLGAFLERLRDPRRLIADHRIGLDETSGELIAAIRRRLESLENRLHGLNIHLSYASPRAKIANAFFVLENVKKEMITGLLHRMENLKTRLEGDMVVLDSLSPLAVLKRGYSITKKIPEGKIIRDAATVAVGSEVDIRVARGNFSARVIHVEEE
jgi:exodeoxyribonuclease VII large subunit